MLVQELNTSLEVLLNVLMAVVGERWMPHIGEGMTELLSLRHEVIQLLNAKPKYYTELSDILLYTDSNLIEEVLNQVADKKPQSECEIYVLKPGKQEM